MTMHGSRIPYFAKNAANAFMWGIGDGCDNDATICAVKGTAQGCWQEKRAREEYCADCPVGFDWCMTRIGRVCTTVKKYAFTPTFYPERLGDLARVKQPRNIVPWFYGDMFSPGVRVGDRLLIWQAAIADPRHNYITLTKNPPDDMDDVEWFALEKLDGRLWFGITVTHPGDTNKLTRLDSVPNSVHRWLSLEPILGPPPEGVDLSGIDFIVLGALTDGHRRVIPESEGGTKAADVFAWVKAIGRLRKTPPLWFKRLPAGLKHLASVGNRIPAEWEALR